MQTVIAPGTGAPPLSRIASRIRWTGVGAAIAVAALLWFAPLHQAAEARHGVAIGAGVIVLFATEAVLPAIAGVIGLLCFWLAGVAPLATLTVGLRSESVWFIAGALVLGVAASRTGLAQRLAYAVLARAGNSYPRLLLGFIVADFALTFLVPSGNARVTILAAVVAGLVLALDLPPRGPVARGLLLTVTYTAGIFDKMILAGAASILGRGLVEELTGIRISYAQWFLAYLPCDILTIGATWLGVLWLFPAQGTLAGSAQIIDAERARAGAMTAPQRRAAILLGIAVLLWMTDIVHGLPPAYVALGVGLVALLPGAGVLSLRDLRAVPIRVLVFAAAVLGLSAALSRSGGLEVLTGLLVSWLEPLARGPASMSLSLYWTAFVYHFFLGSESSMLSATLPAVLRFAEAQHLPVAQVGLIWIFASGGKIFAYQSTVLMVGYAYGYFDRRDLLKLGLLLTVVESLVLLILVPFYWPLIFAP